MVKLGLESIEDDFWLGIPNLFNIFSSLKKGKKVQKKDILLDDIMDIDMDESDFSTLEISYLLQGEETVKPLTLQFENPAICLYVLAKLRFLMLDSPL